MSQVGVLQSEVPVQEGVHREVGHRVLAWLHDLQHLGEPVHPLVRHSGEQLLHPAEIGVDGHSRGLARGGDPTSLQRVRAVVGQEAERGFDQFLAKISI
jgi:hypothetical protein